MTGGRRNPSAKYPCGERGNECCKEGTLACQKCGIWYHGNACSGVPSSLLNAIKKSKGLIWLCKLCEEHGKRKLEDEPEEDTNLKKLKIEKRLVDQKTSLTKINNCIEIEIENRFKKLEETLDTKLNEIIDKQEKIPCEIKSAWKPQTNIQPQKLKVIMHETLTEQEKEQLDLEKREQNLILFNVKECIGQLRPKKTAI